MSLIDQVSVIKKVAEPPKRQAVDKNSTRRRIIQLVSIIAKFFPKTLVDLKIYCNFVPE